MTSLADSRNKRKEMVAKIKPFLKSTLTQLRFQRKEVQQRITQGNILIIFVFTCSQRRDESD